MPKTSSVLDAQARLAQAVKERKEAVCVAPTFPGKPSDYRYVPERCVPKAKRARDGPKKYKVVRIHADDVEQARKYLDYMTTQNSSTPMSTTLYAKLNVVLPNIVASVLATASRVKHAVLIDRIDACSKLYEINVNTTIVRVFVCEMLVALTNA